MDGSSLIPDWKEDGTFQILRAFTCILCANQQKEGKEVKSPFREVLVLTTTCCGGGPTAYEYLQLARDFRDHLIACHGETIPNREQMLLAALKSQEKEGDVMVKKREKKRQRVEARNEHAYDVSAALRPFRHRPLAVADSDDDL